MAKKNQDSPVFEIVIVLAIVAIVAVTGQVLLRFENPDNSITGFAVSDFEEEVEEIRFLDIGVDDIQVTPPSPLIGRPFEIRVIVANKGFEEISTPFYIEVKLMPNVENVKPTVFHSFMTKILKPGDRSYVVFNVAAISNEGPLRIIATADSTVKLADDNPSNDQRSKTVILTTK